MSTFTTLYFSFLARLNRSDPREEWGNEARCETMCIQDLHPVQYLLCSTPHRIFSRVTLLPCLMRHTPGKVSDVKLQSCGDRWAVATAFLGREGEAGGVSATVVPYGGGERGWSWVNTALRDPHARVTRKQVRLSLCLSSAFVCTNRRKAESLRNRCVARVRRLSFAENAIESNLLPVFPFSCPPSPPSPPRCDTDQCGA